MLPAKPAQLQARADEAVRRSYEIQRARLNGAAAEMELRAVGRRQAEEISGDYRYVWRPGYY